MSKLIRSARNSVLLAGLAAPALLTSPLLMTGAYANTLTRLLPDLYAALNHVSRELVGVIPGVNRNTGAERAAVGQSVVWPVAPEANVVDITPAMTVPEPTDQEIGNGAITITKSRAAQFGYTGEEQKGLNTGPGYLTLQQQQIAQALRKLTNEIESDLFTAAYKAASRAYGTPGTVPFATDLSASAQIRKILDDNGADPSDRSLVINTAAGANLRTLMQLTRVNEAGTQMTLRDGQLLDIHGFAIRESGQAKDHTKGTAAGSTTNAAGYAIGATTITLASAGTGTIVAGDTVTFAGDTNKYVVKTGDADVSNGGTIVLNAPGLRVAIAAGATAITVGNSYAASVAFARSAFALAARAPALPVEGDMASDSFMLTDPRSGITFEVRVYLGYRKVRYEIGLAWGWAAINSEGIALLLG